MSHRLPPSRLFSLLLIATLSLSACQSSEEKAEEHYQSALRLLGEQDEERAIVEFRNVFQLNGFHRDARQAYADLMLKRGQINEAYGQYLRLIEQYPDTLSARLTLAELAVGRNDWDEVARHGKAAIALDANDPRNKTLAIILEYRTAMTAGDEAAVNAVVEKARSALSSRPEDALLRRIVLDALVTSGDSAAALIEVDRLLEREPASFEFNVVRLQLLNALADQQAVGIQLRRMYELAPENKDLQATLIQWHMSQKDLDGAEAFLRELAGPDSGPIDGHVSLVQFLKIARNPAAAQTELERLIAAVGDAPQSNVYRALRAALTFEAGQRREALDQFAQIFSAVTDTEDSPQLRDIRVTYARALDVDGQHDAANAEIERILDADPSHVEALKVRSKWKIDADRPGEAIIDLRNALNQAPRDTSVLTLMAEAHLREGSPELAGERLALAVEASGGRAEEAMRYAQFLNQQQRPEVASRVLADARRTAPSDLRILGLLVETLVAMQDWTGAEEVISAVGQIGTDEAKIAEQRLRTALALSQNRTDEALQILQGIAEGGGSDVSVIAATLQTQARSGKLDEARAFLDSEIAKAPDSVELKILSANLDMLRGDTELAETNLRQVIADHPKSDGPVRLLYNLLVTTGRKGEAMQALDAGLAEVPNSSFLLWIKAGELEKAGDVPGAIGLYERLYERDSGNPIIANNLASLLSVHRSDAETLERAYAIARRLRGSQVPAFQDTYGWIEFRRGNFDDALANLEPASLGLPEDALVQFHLGMTYAALGRTTPAKATLEKAIALAGDSTLPQFAIARQTLTDLGAAVDGTPVIPPGLTLRGSGN